MLNNAREWKPISCGSGGGIPGDIIYDGGNEDETKNLEHVIYDGGSEDES